MQKLPCVLLIDDDPTTNFLNEQLLRGLGVTDEVLVARNGEQALTLLARTGRAGLPRPALILLDLNMPVMNGIDFLEAYQPAPPAAPILTVILTTSVHPTDLERLRLLPHAGLLSKPLNRAKIDQMLREYFKRQLPVG